MKGYDWSEYSVIEGVTDVSKGVSDQRRDVWMIKHER